MNKGARRTHESGFTLLEIVVAFAAVAIVLAIVLRVFTGGIDSATRAENHVLALLWAESKLAELGVSEPLVIGTASGAFDTRYRWTATVAPYEDTTLTDEAREQVRPLAVELVVSWEERRRERALSLRTIRLVPVAAEGPT